METPGACRIRILVALLLLAAGSFLADAASADRLLVEGATLPSKRQGAAAAWTGSVIYVLGGLESASPLVLLDDVVSYAPGGLSAARTGATLPTPRAHISAVWMGGHVYVFGGDDASGTLDDVLRYSPATNQVTHVADLPQPLRGTAAASDGQHVFIFGGVGSDRIYRFDPSTSQSPQLMESRLPRQLHDLAAVWTGNEILLFGGAEEGSSIGSDRIHRYIPTTDSLETLPERLPKPLHGMAAARVGGYHYLAGGTVTEPGFAPYLSSTILRHDPLSHAVAPMNATLPFLRSHAAGAVAGPHLYILGGLCSCASYAANTILRYDPQHPELVPDFRVFNPPARAAELTQFVDNSTSSHSPIVKRDWRFGDGGASESLHPSHLFGSQGTYTVSLTLTDSRGRVATLSRKIEVVNHPPFALFSVTPVAPTTSDAIQFVSRASDPDGRIQSYEWDFGDGTRAQTQNATHQYALANTYRVRFTVTDNDGATDSREGILAVSLTPPRAAFGYEPMAPAVQQYVRFRDASRGQDAQITSWRWDFGDGATSTEQNPEHFFAAPGTFVVELTVQDRRGLAHKAAQAVAVAPADINFEFSPTIPLVGTEVAFSDSSPDPDAIVAWRWSFGDGTATREREPRHRFGQTGSFSVELTTTRTDGSSRSFARTVRVAPAPPEAAFNVTPAAATTADTLLFQDATTGGGIRKWSWDFGDGTNAEGAAATHRFPAVGDYRVTLAVENIDGVRASATRTITVTGALTVPPVANFTWGQDPTRLSRLRFQEASNDSDGLVVYWQWEFGDGARILARTPAPADVLAPVHQYAAPGNYTVVLSVADDLGATTSLLRQVHVGGEPPRADFVAEAAAPVAGSPVTFTHSATDADGLVASLKWSFGDGTFSTEFRPAHTFARPGTYAVRLEVTDSDGYAASHQEALEILDPASAGPTRTGPPASGMPAPAVLPAALGLAAMAALRRRR